MSESTGIQVPRGDLREILRNPHNPQFAPNTTEFFLKKPMIVAAEKEEK
jgi:hypothetical protein